MDVTSNTIFADKLPAPIPGCWRDSSAELSDTDGSRGTSITPNRPRPRGTTPSHQTDRKGRHVSPQTLEQYLARFQDSKEPSDDDSPSSKIDSIFERSSISRASTPLTPPDFADSNSSKRCRRPPSPSPLCQSRPHASSTLDGSPSRPRKTSAQRPTSTLIDLSEISDLQSSIENDTVLTSSNTSDQERGLDVNPPGEAGHAPETGHDPDTVPVFGRFHCEPKLPNTINNDLFRKIRRQELENKITAGKAVPKARKAVPKARKAGPSDTTPAYIYIFTLPSHPGYVKIGKTTAAPQDRVSHQSNGCKLPYTLVEDPYDRPFRGYSAVEQLVMTELCNRRRQFSCSKCKQRHGEWYKISEEKALEVVERWRQWMVSEPYDARGVLTPFWVRKYEEAIQDLTNVQWEDWLCPPSPLDRFRYYLSLVIKGGRMCYNVLYMFAFERREEGQRWSRWEHLCNGGSSAFWLVFAAFWYLLRTLFGWTFTAIAMGLVAIFVL